MIYKTLYTFRLLLNDYLKQSFGLTQDIAFLCPVKDSEKALSNNKINITLVNVERETGRGIQFKYTNTDSNHSRKTSPAWQLSIYVLISAVFSEKQYEESLQILSGILSFLQTNNLLTVQDAETPVSIEPVNLSFQELSNLWSICGGNYYPSLLCKIRVLTVDEQEISGMSTVIGKPEVETKKSET